MSWGFCRGVYVRGVFVLSPDFLSLQKPLTLSLRVFVSSQNSLYSSHLDDNLLNIGITGLSNGSNTFTSGFTEHAYICLSIHPVWSLTVFLCSLFFLSRRTNSVSLLQSPELSGILKNLNLHCQSMATWHLLAASSKLVQNFNQAACILASVSF